MEADTEVNNIRVHGQKFYKGSCNMNRIYFNFFMYLILCRYEPIFSTIIDDACQIRGCLTSLSPNEVV